jgi:hypothetical protein
VISKALQLLRTRGLAAALLLAAAGLVTACGSSGSSVASSNGPITVCGDLALSGPYTQIGQTDNWGAQAYFKYINAHGGIHGHKVNYTVIDNQSQPAQAALIAQKCIRQKKASFIVGPESGADTEAALPIAIANKTILISLSSGWQTNGYKSSELTSYGFPGFYDVFAEDQIASAKNVIVPQHMTRVALIENACGPVCTANQATVQQLAKQDHFKLVATQVVPLACSVWCRARHPSQRFARFATRARPSRSASARHVSCRASSRLPVGRRTCSTSMSSDRCRTGWRTRSRAHPPSTRRPPLGCSSTSRA